ncbi:MAG TPA: DUF2442 domain-containing protein [Casimicrobiaceae bacterium]|nr:DUF2442 domain-containing protein [Casimicrobiaceae bacterium]
MSASVPGVRVGPPGSKQYVPGDEPRALAARCTRRELIVTLADGRVVHVPLDWFDRLKAASPEARKRCTIDFGGAFLHWPDAGEDISVARLLAPHCPVCLKRLHREHSHGGRARA